MKKMIFGCLGAAAVAFALQFTQADVQAGLFNNCNPCDEVGPCDDLCGPCDAVCAPVKAGKWFVNGHMEAGFYANAHGRTSTYTGDGHLGPYGLTGRGADYWSGNTDLLQNTRLTNAQVNQVYISMGKAVDGRRGLDIGGTVDFTWGSDAYMVQADGIEINAKNPSGWGMGDYYAAFAQAYAEAEWGRWNVKAGKFYAPFGSTAYKSTDNFFYTWAPTMSIAPTTGTGAYATFAVNKDLALIGGWAMADSCGTTYRFDDAQFHVGLGGISWKASDRLSLLYTFAVGDVTWKGTNDHIDAFVNTFLVNYQISKRLKYVFEWTLLNHNDHVDGVKFDYAAAWGLNNELVYQFNKKWAFGARFGVLCDNGLAALGPKQDADWYTMSLGANWTPNKWLTVKPELRYDWLERYNNQIIPFNEGRNTYQFSGGMSAVVKF